MENLRREVVHVVFNSTALAAAFSPALAINLGRDPQEWREHLKQISFESYRGWLERQASDTPGQEQVAQLASALGLDREEVLRAIFDGVMQQIRQAACG
jgi:hypothetical protein